MEEKQREHIVLNYLDAYNRFDTDGMLANLDNNILFENISNNVNTLELHGLTAFKEQAEKAKALFTERKQKATSFQHEGNKTVVQIDYYAILAVDLPNGPKKGEALQLQGKSIFTFNNHRIISITYIS